MGLAPSHQPAAMLLLLRRAWRVRSQGGARAGEPGSGWADSRTQEPDLIGRGLSDRSGVGPECLEGGSGLTAVGRVHSVRLWRRDLE